MHCGTSKASQAESRLHKSIIISSPVMNVPIELRKQMTVLDFDLPTYEQISDFLTEAANTIGHELSDDEQERLVKALQGLTMEGG